MKLSDLAKSVASTLAEAFLSLADMPTDDGKAQHGRVTTTAPTSNDNGESISTLIAKRDALMAQIARQRKAHKRVSTYEAQLRAVTLELVRRA